VDVFGGVAEAALAVGFVFGKMAGVFACNLFAHIIYDSTTHIKLKGRCLWAVAILMQVYVTD